MSNARCTIAVTGSVYVPLIDALDEFIETTDVTARTIDGLRRVHQRLGEIITSAKLDENVES